MPHIPRERVPDSTLALLREGYRFLPNRMRRHKSDIFKTRLALKRAICASGAEAAEMFYTPDRFERAGALPPTTARLLQDTSSVQMLEGAAHRHRKAMFMQMMSPESIARLTSISGRLWEERIDQWSQLDRVVLLDEMENMLCAAACEWAGLALKERSTSRRTDEFSAMIAGSGAVGPDVLRALLLRQRSEIWARRIIRDARRGRNRTQDISPVSIIARHRDEAGDVLPTKIAAVELINVLRPVVAVARYIVFVAHALEQHPELRDDLASGDDDHTEWFVQEVRRLYPFFPFVAGIARQPFIWRDYSFKEGDWVILDIYGTNRDERSWVDAKTFHPARFREWSNDPFTLVPQGAGEHATTHRCPGEWITIALMKQAAILLSRGISYRVPGQDLSIGLRSMPTQPASGFIITDVRRHA